MRASRMVVLAAVPLVVLTACNRAEPAANSAAASARPLLPAAAIDVRRPLNALGTEPFWSLRIRPEGLSYSDPETPELNAPDPVYTPDPDGARWTAGVEDGRRMEAHLEAKPCDNGMSGVSYPFTARLSLGDKTVSGCAAYADDMPRPGG